MLSKKIIMYCFCVLSVFSTVISQEIPRKVNIGSAPLKHSWRANWITHPTASVFDYGVYHFRKTFNLHTIPSSFIVHVSADNRYQLYVNGEFVSDGPARGDLANWNYATIDIASYLNNGKNVIAALVVNFGEYKAGGQISNRTSFILQDEVNDLISTISEWKVVENEAYDPVLFTPELTPDYGPVFGFYASGPFDEIDCSLYPWGWETLDYDDSKWLDARAIRPGVGRGYAYGNTVFLVPRSIPHLERAKQRIAEIVRSDGISKETEFLKGKSTLIIPKNSKSLFLIDNKTLTIGYPELFFSKGKDSQIKITYAESLFDNHWKKGNRNEIDGKEIHGCYDIILPDGGSNRVFKPLWLRPFRYIQFEIETKDESLTLHDYYNIFSAYPLKEKASFKSDDESLSKIWDASWRSLRLCAQETYFSDAYYEQMQYIGDTRVQALASIYVSGDDLLMRNALKQFDQSRVPNGLTQSRYPAHELQIIPPYSLMWIVMIHDFYRLRDDAVFIQQFIPGIKSVLAWFEKHIDSSGMLGGLDWWNFGDWAADYQVGIPIGADDSHSALITLQYVYTLQKVSELFDYLNLKMEANDFRQQALSAKKAVYNQCYDSSGRIFSETPEKQRYSQHTNIFSILTGTCPEDEQHELMNKILTDPSLIQCTFYFKFYLFQALKQIGMGDQYNELLNPWRELIRDGLTTFPEDIRKPPRSDCHPWAASPAFHLLSIIAGIQPAEPGFKSVQIVPDFGGLKVIDASMPHPKGEIKINLKRDDSSRITGKVELPEGLTGKIIWNQKENKLSHGINTITM